MDHVGNLVFSILLGAGNKGVALEIDQERVEVAAEISAGHFLKAIEKRSVNGKTGIRLNAAFLKALDGEIARRRKEATEVADSANKIITLPPKRLILPSGDPNEAS